MSFTDKNIIWLLLLLIPLSLIAVRTWRLRKKRMNQFAEPLLFERIAPLVVYKRLAVKSTIILCVFGLLIFALSGPRFGAVNEVTVKKSADIVIALDVSLSMLAEDVQPTRLQRAKLAISTLFKKLKGDRIALVVFAGDAYIQLPLTNDYSAGEMFLDAVNPELIPVQGTALAAAIQKSRDCFTQAKSEDLNRAIILITDGENHEDDPVEQAKLAKEEGVVIYTVGVGDPKGTPIPVYQNNLVVGYKTDKSGSTVVSKLNDKILMDIAAASGGIYIHGNNTVAALDRILKEIEKLDRKETAVTRYTENENRFQFFVAFALVLLILEYLISERRSLKKRFNRIFE